jgi:phosphatidylserine/phosphatidylglycerophosphate/cardiolipin synthase-like enzyme
MLQPRARQFSFGVLPLVIGLLAAAAPRVDARDDLCDPAVTNCRTPLLALINAETVEIDVGMWFMEDARYANAIIARHNAGVKVRIIYDNRSDGAGHPANQTVVNQLLSAGIPMRRRVATGIEHWKVMLFDRQNTVYFGSANFSEEAFVPAQPYVNYTDETVYFTDNPTVVNSFRTKFDDAWVDTSDYVNQGNVSTLVRHYSTFPIDPELNFPPGSNQDFVQRSANRIDAEGAKLDVMMYRIADDRALNSMIGAHKRGVPIRLIVDSFEYRDTARYQIALYVDKLYMAGIPMRVTVHQGLNHGKLALLYGQGMSVFGSGNWTKPSANLQHEENYFTKNPAIFNWFVKYFERRWNNSNPAGVKETAAFKPLPPSTPSYRSPSDGATGVATTGTTLKWWAGKWPYNYDIYFGTSSTPPLFLANQALGPSISDTDLKSITLPTLQPGTRYFWKIVSKTAANMTASGPTWSFVTNGTAPPPNNSAPEIVLWTASVSTSNIHGDWIRLSDSLAAGGVAMRNPDAGRAKIAPALASPANYFEMTFTATKNVAYHVWVRMRALGNSLGNDSIHLQFSDSVTAGGSSWARIGTTSSLEPVLQDGPGGAPPHGWGWTDNGWGSMGPPIYFSTTGTHTLRIQQREDGATVDQIVLSPQKYFSRAPGSRTDDGTILAKVQ